MRASLMLLVGCTSGAPSSPTVDAAVSIDAPVQHDAPSSGGGTFALTSSMLTNSGTFSAVNTCDGANTSPAFAWTSPPVGTMSYALVLTDTTITLTHAVTYDIPMTATALPAALAKVYAPADPAGTHQAPSISNTPGYSGPCPPQGQAAHVYEFALYALDVATLPGTDMTSTRAQLTPLITQHMIDKVTLTASYARP
ncbi:MAG: YbhB/YbcL family Raf kinase inhibitor-like protein [Kofleriaceae bacterium]